MTHIFDAIILGAVQGLTEFLPVSSSGHLLLAHHFLHYSPGHELAFDVALHIGTLLALLSYFWRDIVTLVRNAVASFRVRPLTSAHRLPWLLVIAAVPAAAFGAAFDSFFASLRNPWIVVVTFIVVGAVFLMVERRGATTRTMHDMNWKTALGIGFAQVLSLVPGVSRSGITIAAGMAAGVQRADAARFTFLLSIPVVAGAAAKKLLEVRSAGVTPEERTLMLVGIITAAVVGYLVIRLLLRFLAHHRLDVFAYYRITLAALVTAGLLLRW